MTRNTSEVSTGVCRSIGQHVRDFVRFAPHHVVTRPEKGTSRTSSAYKGENDLQAPMTAAREPDPRRPAIRA